jgi:hypothetical protein
VWSLHFCTANGVRLEGWFCLCFLCCSNSNVLDSEIPLARKIESSLFCGFSLVFILSVTSDCHCTFFQTVCAFSDDDLSFFILVIIF